MEYGLKDYKSQRSGRAGVKCRLDKTRPLYSKAHSCRGRPHKVSTEEETHMLLALTEELPKLMTSGSVCVCGGVFFDGVAPCRLTELQGKPYTHEYMGSTDWTQ